MLCLACKPDSQPALSTPALPAAQKAKPAPAEPPARPVHLAAVGDIMMAGPMGRLMQVKGRDYPFARMAPLLRRADIAFGNLECAVATTGQPIPKQFNFRADPSTLEALVNAGFDIVSLANNHAWDYGRGALTETVRRVRKAGIVPVGAGDNRAEAHKLVTLRKNGQKIGFLAYLGLLPALIPESETEPSLAMASVETIQKEVAAARPQVDVLIVSLHAGQEMAAYITPRQRSFAQAAIDSGADLVIGHHPHVVQPLVTYRGKPICYSLGNFVFSTTGRGSGALLEATLLPGGKVKARMRHLDLSGGQPRLRASESTTAQVQ